MKFYTYDVKNNLDLYIDEKNVLELLKFKSFCFGYTRQSTNKQNSIEEQVYYIKKRAFENNYEYLLLFICRGSGWDVNNLNKLKDFTNMMKIIPKLRNNNLITLRNFVIYVYDVSRFMRNILIASKFINDVLIPNNCEIHSIIDNKKLDNNNNNRIEFFRELIESENYSVLLSNKIKKNISNRKRLGHHIGSVKFGYEKYRDHNLIYKVRKNNIEQNILGYIKKKYNHRKKLGVSNVLSTICNNLNSNKILKRNKYWNKNILKRLVKDNDFKNVNECDLILSPKVNWLQCDICDKWRVVDFSTFCKFKTINNFFCYNLPYIKCENREVNYDADNEIEVTNNSNSLSELMEISLDLNEETNLSDLNNKVQNLEI